MLELCQKAKTKKKRHRGGRVSQALAGSFISALCVNKKKNLPFCSLSRCFVLLFFYLFNYFYFDTSDVKGPFCRILWIPSMFCNNSIFRIAGINPFKINLKCMSVLGLDPAICQQEDLPQRCPGSSKTFRTCSIQL